MTDQSDRTSDGGFATHRAANSALRATIDGIYQRLNVVGTTMDAAAPQVVPLAEAVIADLDRLREQANELRATRDYIFYKPGGGYDHDDAIDHLNAQIQGARNIIAMRCHHLDRQQARIARDEARTELALVGDRITQISRTGAVLEAQYKAADPGSREALQAHLQAYQLLATLADLHAERTALSITAGTSPEHQRAARLAEASEMRETAAAGITVTERALAALSDQPTVQ